jgi:hypothetical protein
VGCSALLARCVWLTKFNFVQVPAHFLGTTVTLTGAAAGSPEAAELTFKGTVNSVFVEGKSDALFE